MKTQHRPVVGLFSCIDWGYSATSWCILPQSRCSTQAFLESSRCVLLPASLSRPSASSCTNGPRWRHLRREPQGVQVAPGTLKLPKTVPTTGAHDENGRGLPSGCSIMPRRRNRRRARSITASSQEPPLYPSRAPRTGSDVPHPPASPPPGAVRSRSPLHRAKARPTSSPPHTRGPQPGPPRAPRVPSPDAPRPRPSTRPRNQELLFVGVAEEELRVLCALRSSAGGEPLCLIGTRASQEGPAESWRYSPT